MEQMLAALGRPTVIRPIGSLVIWISEPRLLWAGLFDFIVKVAGLKDHMFRLNNVL